MYLCNEILKHLHIHTYMYHLLQLMKDLSFLKKYNKIFIEGNKNCKFFTISSIKYNFRKWAKRLIKEWVKRLRVGGRNDPRNGGRNDSGRSGKWAKRPVTPTYMTYLHYFFILSSISSSGRHSSSCPVEGVIKSR